MLDLVLAIIPGEWLAAAGAAIAALAAVWFGGRRAGKADAKTKAAEAKADAWEIRNEVDNRVADERDAAQRLRDEWSRK